MKSWHKDLIALGVVVLVIVVVTSVFYPLEKTGTQPEPIIITETPKPVVCQNGETREATCPDGVTTYLNESCVDGEWHQVMYIRNPCEPLPPTEAPIVYADASSGHYKPNDMVSYRGVAGEITTGEIKDGEPIGSPVIITNKGKTLLNQLKLDNYGGYKEVELLIYPQEGDHGEVYLAIDGKDTGYVFKYGSSIEQYLATMKNPEDNGNAFWILEK
jgi:hypothetical protein